MAELFTRRNVFRARPAVFVALCSLATACSTTSPRYFARMETKGRRLIDEQRWQEALAATQTALAHCDGIDWCARDARYQGLFHTTLGQAEERLGHRDLALEHFRKAFHAYPLFFTENYFRMLKESGQFRLLRHEIDVKLASNEAAYRSASAMWLSNEPSACGGRWVAGNYGWSLRAASGSVRVSGKAVISQSGCVVSADIVLAPEGVAGGLLHFRGDVHSAVASLLFGPPCVSADKGQLSLTRSGFIVNADRAAVTSEGCLLRGPYAMEFVKD